MRNYQQIKGDINVGMGVGSRAQLTKGSEAVVIWTERKLAETTLWILLGAAALIYQFQIL